MNLQTYLIQFDESPETDNPEYQEFLKNTPLTDPEALEYESFEGMKHDLAEAIATLDSTECICGLYQSLWGKPDPKCEWHRAMKIASANEYWLGY